MELLADQSEVDQLDERRLQLAPSFFALVGVEWRQVLGSDSRRHRLPPGLVKTGSGAHRPHDLADACARHHGGRPALLRGRRSRGLVLAGTLPPTAASAGTLRTVSAVAWGFALQKRGRMQSRARLQSSAIGDFAFPPVLHATGDLPARARTGDRCTGLTF